MGQRSPGSLLFWGRGPVLRLALPVRRVAGTDQQGRAKLLEGAAGAPSPGACTNGLWPIKYVIFLGLFGLSLYSLTLGRASRRGRAVQDRDHARNSCASGRLWCLPLALLGRRALHRALLLPLPLPARRRARDSRPHADVRVAEALAANAARPASAAPTSARFSRSTPTARSTSTNASTACIARSSTWTITGART